MLSYSRNQFSAGGKSQQLVEIRVPNISTVRIELGDSADRSAIDQLRFTRPRAPAPDLLVEDVAGPTEATPGGVATISWTLSNAGDLSVGELVTERIYLSTTTSLAGAVEVGQVSYQADLAAGQSASRSAIVSIPFNGAASAGEVYWIVRTDADSQVAESNELNNTLATTSTTTIENVLLLATNREQISEEDSNPAATLTLQRSGPLGSQLQGTLLSSDDTEVTLQSNFMFDIGVSTIQIPVDVIADGVKDGDQVVTLTATAGSIMSSVDLTVLDFESKKFADLEPEVVSVTHSGSFATPGETIQASWTVTNSGEIATANAWQDSLYAVLEGQSPVLLTTFGRNAPLEVGNSYSVERSVVLPSFLADGDYVVYVQTDSLESIPEGLGEADNQLSAPQPLVVRHADLLPAIVDIPATTSSGAELLAQWSTSNIGTASSRSGWTDRVFLSVDPTLSNDDVLLGAFAHEGPLAPSNTSSASQLLRIPDGVTGSYYVLVAADNLNQVLEGQEENNNLVSQAINISLAPYADLVPTAINVPSQVIGDPAQVDVSWTVANIGTGAGRDDRWSDSIIISADDILGNDDDALLGSFPRSGLIEQGQSYSKTEQLTLPPALSGRFHLFLQVDSAGQVFENGNEANNIAFVQPFDVMPIPYADLQVSSVATLDPAATGKSMRVQWTIENVGIGQTSTGNWIDTVFLASDPLGEQPITNVVQATHFGFLGPGESYERTVELRVPDDAPSPIYAIVHAADPDIRGNSPPFEFIYANNNESASEPLDVNPSPTPDLVVTSVLNPSEAVEGTIVDVTWTAKNEGDATADGSWIDRVALYRAGESSPEPIVIGSFEQTLPLDAGLSFERTERVRLPELCRALSRSS